jgi:flagellar biosynthesis protein FlhG
MLSIRDLEPSEQQQIRRACGYVFSADRMNNEAFLNSLSFDMVRQAFREKAKRYHPDLHGEEDPGVLEKRKERFVRIMESYEMLKKYMTEEETGQTEAPARRRTIIAVGGAKGGIGKTLFSANLGTYLQRKGYRTVLVDLDLGGANLHLHLGVTGLPLTINDFLDHQAVSLEEIMVTTRYGPKLIGGDSSRLGAANIDFGLKLRLMRAIRRIEADCIVLDLGGDTSYNMIDFFLLADRGLVLTTCDPSSYLDAYNFIKVSLFRKLNRIFGAETGFQGEKDTALQQLIAEATLSSNGSRVKTVGQLLQRIQEQQPHYLGFVKSRIEEYQPWLVVNMAEADSNETEVAERILQVSRKMLSVGVEYVGALPCQEEIKRSVRELVPAVVQYPGKKYWGILERLAGRLGSTAV